MFDCKNCGKLIKELKEKDEELILMETDLAGKSTVITSQDGQIASLNNRVKELESGMVSPVTTVDLTPYFYKLDRIAALVKTDDKNTFLEELDNFKTMLNHIRRENDTSS